MKLEKQVCSLELAEKLEKLNVKQDSLWYWIQFSTEGSFVLRDAADNFGECYSAFTVAELGELLPKMITFQETSYFFTTWKRENSWATQYKPNKGQNYFPAQLAETEADARAKMLIYLLENKLINP